MDLSIVQQPIAIVGVAAQLPSGNTSTDNLDSKQFFEFLLNKGEAYEKIPLERFNIDAFNGSDAGHVASQYGTFLKATDQIDHVELGISSKDAKAMSLSTRKLIELSFLALLDSGIDYRNKNVGCFASGIIFDILSLSESDEFDAHGSFAGVPAMIANRISYHLDLTGPSIPVDTACSSSLTATHLAVQAIRMGDCDTAVVGGMQLNHRFVDWVQYSQGGILAPDGKCKPFDAGANGFSRGEAGVVIVLKRLDQALADKDHIYGTILGTGINSAGSAAPVNAPVAEAQRDAMRRAWDQTRRQPNEVDFVELHATGTAAGDPAEANWVGDIFHPGRNDELLIGSVKGNIGHTEIVAFLASLTKVINMFATRIIPANVNLFRKNPLIKWDEYQMGVPTENIPLPCVALSGKSLVAICSAGIGGANGHVIIESPPPSVMFDSRTSITREDQAIPKASLLVAGGLSPRTAATVSEHITAAAFANPSRMKLLSTIYGRRSKQMIWRSFSIYSPTTAPSTHDSTETQGKLEFSVPTFVPRVQPPLVFVFCGQGPQHFHMGRELYGTYLAFRESILEMDNVYRCATGISLLESTGLFCDDSSCAVSIGDVWPIDITLPALAMLQCALVDLLASVGVKPDIVVAHSAGEAVIMYASGMASKAMVVDLAIARGRAMSLMENHGGTMAAVSCSILDAQNFVSETLGAELANTVDIACHNSRDAVTLAGLASSIDEIVTHAKSQGFMASKLRTRVPVHSHMMELCSNEFRSSVEQVWSCYPAPRKPMIPVYSSVTGTLLVHSFSRDYFWDGTRGPVLFAETVTALLATYPASTFMEISPHPVLSSYLSSLGAKNILAPLRRPKRNETKPAEVVLFLQALGQLTCLGDNRVDFSALNGDPVLDSNISLSPYPFNSKSVSYHSESISFHRRFQERNGPLNYPGLRINSQTHSVLAQHVIKGEPIMPAAGFIEMALEFGAMELWDVEFRAMLSLSAEQPTPVEVARDGIHWMVKTSAASEPTTKHHVVFDKLHAQGYLSLGAPQGKYDALNISELLARCERIDITSLYADLKSFAEYGPQFRRVVGAYQGENEVLVLVNGADGTLDLTGYRFHPAIMDCCLHFMVHKYFTLNTDSNVYYLPSKVGRVIIHSAMQNSTFPERAYAHIVFETWTPGTIVADISIVTSDGSRLCTLTQVEIERHESSPQVPVSARFDIVFQPWEVPSAIVEERDILIAHPDDMRQFYNYLDYQASDVLSRTMMNKPLPGKEVDRKRYWDFAHAIASSSILPQALDENVIREFNQKWPEMAEITSRVASVHSNIFESSKAAVGALYKDDLMKRFYEHYDWASKACADRFRLLLSSMISVGKTVINVLEVGAGTGALTRHLVGVISEFPSVTIEIFVTDISKDLLPRIPYARTRHMAFDLSKPAGGQGFQLASFDIIMGFHVLHAVPSISSCLEILNGLLIPGGSLLIGDLDGDSWTSRAPGSIWFDFVFGSFAEWFAFTDSRSHCTMSAQEWRDHLHAAAFGNVIVSSFSGDPLLFVLEAQKLQPLTTVTNGHDVVVFRYERGREPDLRLKLSDHDASAPLSLWLSATSGHDGDAATGLSRSLGREYAVWDVYLVIFDGTWDDLKRISFVSALSSKHISEPLLIVDRNGKILVPRIIPSPPPSQKSSFRPSLPWIFSQTTFVQRSLIPHGEGFATVNLLAISHPERGIRGFVGHISSASGSTSVVEGDLVVGIMSSLDFPNTVVVPLAALARLPTSDEHLAADIAGVALGLCISVLACGGFVLYSKRRSRGGKALLVHASPTIRSSIRWFLGFLHFEVVESESGSPVAISNLNSRFNLIVSGSDSSTDFQACCQKRAHNGRLFMWNDPHTGVGSILENDPLAIGEALDFAVGHIAGRWSRGSRGLHITDVAFPEPGTLVPNTASLFDSEKAYILVGGIGGLGIRIALWMYEKGARYLVLTSRSGRDSLVHVQDRLALRVVEYLLSIPDLILKLEASDATSQESTGFLLDRIPIPLGGCMLLSVVLSDRMFAFQNVADFTKVFAPKIDAYSTLARCIPGGLSSLDFLVSFSSVVGLFGNAGQTNYSSANTALDGMVRNLDNAFTFVLPAVLDSGGLASESREQGGRLGHLTPWGMSAQSICDCLEDGLRKLADGPFWQYIPALDWSVVQKHMGPSILCGHLVDANTASEASVAHDDGKSMLDVIIDILDVGRAEFSDEVPFTAYGLDSLSAAKLSYALRPYLAISQLQLLSDVSFNDIKKRIDISE